MLRCFSRALVLLVLGAFVGISSRPAAAAPNAGASVIFDWSVLNASGGTMATYTYDPAQDVYYVGTFGAFTGLHRIARTSPGGPFASNAYVGATTSSFPSDMLRFMRASDVIGGQVSTSTTGTSLIGGILLNPQPVTISVPQPDANGDPTATMMNVTFPAGALAFVTDGGASVATGATQQPAWTKKIYRWDLRAIGSTTPPVAQPDYATGTNGLGGGPPADGSHGGAFGALGQVDWNDTLTVGMTEADMRTAYANYAAANPGLGLPAWGTGTAAANTNFSRQSVWSSDGQSIYAVDSATTSGGIYKMSAATGATQMLYSEPGGSNIIAEPAVLHTSLRNLGGGFGAGDQILFDGNATNGNTGGLSYVVHNGSATSTVKTLFTGAQLAAYTQTAASGSRVDSIATDASGNIYFTDGGTIGIHKLDAQGRFISVFNRAQLFELAHVNDGLRAQGGGMLRLQVRQEGGATFLTFRGDNKFVGVAQVFDPGDITRDGTYDQTDRDQFIEQMGRFYHGGNYVPNPFAANDSSPGALQDYLDYINADVNGNGVPRTATVALPLPGLTAGGVDLNDLSVLKQFIELKLADFDWDGDAWDAADKAIFNAHFDIPPSTFNTGSGPWSSYSWFDGDVSGPTSGVPDGLVNQFDFNFIMANAAQLPEPGALATMFTVAAVACMAFYVRGRKRRTGVSTKTA